MKCNFRQSPNQEVWSRELKLRFNTSSPPPLTPPKKTCGRAPLFGDSFFTDYKIPRAHLNWIRIAGLHSHNIIKVFNFSLVSPTFDCSVLLNHFLCSQLPPTSCHSAPRVRAGCLHLFSQIFSYCNILLLFSPPSPRHHHHPILSTFFCFFPFYSSPHIFPLCVFTIVILLSIIILFLCVSGASLIFSPPYSKALFVFITLLLIRCSLCHPLNASPPLLNPNFIIFFFF